MFDFLQIIPLKIMPFFSGKPAESDNFFVDYTANRYAFYQTNLLKVLTFPDYTAESHAFPWYNLLKVLTFKRLSCGKTFLSAV
jgi:hypothetical protein